MDDPRRILLEVTPKKTIRDFVDMLAVRHYLVEYPNLLLMFEILINHIEDYIQLKEIVVCDTVKSSHL